MNRVEPAGAKEDLFMIFVAPSMILTVYNYQKEACEDEEDESANDEEWHWLEIDLTKEKQ